MTGETPQFEPGQRIQHAEFGEGVVVGLAREGYLRAFFTDGERQVPERSIESLASWTDRVLAHVEGNETEPIISKTPAHTSDGIALRLW